MLTRSLAVALGVGIAWFGPVEHILRDSWSSTERIFPGLSLEAFLARGTHDVSAEHALVVIAIYGAVAAAIAAATFTRWDVTT